MVCRRRIILGKLTSLKKWLEILQKEGPAFFYFPEPTKSYLIEDEGYISQAKTLFEPLVVNVVSGHRYLGSSIGSKEHKSDYLRAKADEWSQSVQKIAEAAESYPHESLSTFTRCLQNEWGFLSRVLPECQDWLWKVEESITQNFIPKLLKCDISVDERNLFSLPVRNPGLGINNPIIEAPYSLGTSKLATSHIQNAIRGNCTLNKLEHGFTVREARKLHSETVKVRNTSNLNHILETSSERKVKALKRSAENKNSAWLTAKSSSKDHFSLSAQEFRDAVCLRCLKPISKLPGICDGCGGEFSIHHALACTRRCSK